MTTEFRKRLDDVIDLRFLFIFWLKWSWLVIPLALIGAYFGYRDLQRFQPQYVAKMIVMPTGGGGRSAQNSQVSSVLSGLGLTLNSGSGPSTFDRLGVVLSSISLAQRLQTKYHLMQTVFAGSWDSETGSWIRPSGEKFERRERVAKFLRRNKWTPPNLETLAQYVGGSVKIEPVRSTSFFEISVTNKDPQFALDFLNLAYRQADELLREQDRIESQRRRDYIDTQLEKETKTITLNALRGLKAREEQTRMLLESDLAYVARVIEPAFVSSTATEPNIPQIFGFPIVVSVIIGLGLLTLVAVFRRG